MIERGIEDRKDHCSCDAKTIKKRKRLKKLVLHFLIII